MVEMVYVRVFCCASRDLIRSSRSLVPSASKVFCLLRHMRTSAILISFWRSLSDLIRPSDLARKRASSFSSSLTCASEILYTHIDASYTSCLCLYRIWSNMCEVFSHFAYHPRVHVHADWYHMYIPGSVPWSSCWGKRSSSRRTPVNITSNQLSISIGSFEIYYIVCEYVYAPGAAPQPQSCVLPCVCEFNLV